MKNIFKIGQRVKILSKEQLKDLCHQGEDITADMFEYGGMEATIVSVRDNTRWAYKDRPEYKLDIDDEYWVWYQEVISAI